MSRGHQLPLFPTAHTEPSKRPVNMTIKHKFKQWLRNWLQDEVSKPLRLEESHELESKQPLRISIHKASGGLVIETRSYDSHKDRNNQSLHIVTHEDNLADALSKIITMESLR